MLCIRTYIRMFLLDNEWRLYVANNHGDGYVSRLFDNNLGYFYTFLVDGDYIYADRVRI